MADLSKLKNINVSFKKNGKFLGFGSSPGADWEVIFIMAALLTVLVIVMGVRVFIKIDKGEFASMGETEETPLTLDEARLTETVRYYEAKAAKFESIKNARVNLVDPSL